MVPRRRQSAKLQADWAMVAAHHLGQNPGALERGTEPLRRHTVVDAPSDVARAAIAHLAPPGIMSAAFFEFRESVDKARRQEPRKITPLLVSEPRVAPVRLWIGQIDFRVRHIQVAAKQDRLFPVELLQVLEKRRVPG